MNDPQVVKFCNEGLRVTADKLAIAYLSAKQLLQSYDATGMAAVLGDDPQFTTVIDDGSAQDGRPPITVGGVKLTMENIRGLISQLETADSGTGLTMVQGILSISPRYNG